MPGDENFYGEFHLAKINKKIKCKQNILSAVILVSPSLLP
jgi:hypothetical protein